ncbi:MULTISPECIES: response regulator transcription factor [Anaeromyxobacter]|uniref:response regulator transcription factor n=1 Tax=Anaeromyxobacter TaxID=161492 RepID=UPI001F58C989|nr:MULTISPECIES: response regulator [unclassified Anaeromyxobacter]
MDGPRVLLVDDDPDICEFLGILLATEGLASAAASTADEALAAVSTAAAVLLDVAMPGMDGLELCRRMRAAGFAGPILIVSARPSPDLPRRAVEAGANGFVRKPFENAELVALLRSHLSVPRR